jgi:hypothetical protein
MGNIWLDKDELEKHVKHMIGAPVLKLESSVADALEYFIDLSYRYKIDDKKSFCVEMMNDFIVYDDNKVSAPAWENEDE